MEPQGERRVILRAMGFVSLSGQGRSGGAISVVAGKRKLAHVFVSPRFIWFGEGGDRHSVKILFQNMNIEDHKTT